MSYFYRGAYAFSLAKLNFVVHNIVLSQLVFAGTLFATIVSESKKCLLLLYPTIEYLFLIRNSPRKRTLIFDNL